LSEHFRVVALDHRGHGRGIRSSRTFRLADCADDAAMVAAELGISSVIAVGYSMGGPIAQLLWRQHRPLVDGLVLCATAPSFVPRTREGHLVRSIATITAGGTRLGGRVARPMHHAARQLPRMSSRGPRDFREWAAEELRRHDWRMLIEAAHAVGTYDAWSWIHTIDVPTAVVLSTRDRAVPTRAQLAMAEAIPHANVHPVDDGHAVCARPGFVQPIVAACLDVAGRAGQPGTQEGRSCVG
jgi:pimeloyl-ACP methyl ester carboxylesterase